MSKKKIDIGGRPSLKQQPGEDMDAWVNQNKVDGKDKSMKRLTVDIPESLHRQLKSDCAMRGTKIADEIRKMLANKYRN